MALPITDLQRGEPGPVASPLNRGARCSGRSDAGLLVGNANKKFEDEIEKYSYNWRTGGQYTRKNNQEIT